MKGNSGLIISVDLTSGSITRLEPPFEWYRAFLGGSGLAAKLFWEYGDFSAAPLAPEALLVFTNGPLATVRLSGTSRFSAAARSPLTGTWSDSSCGGFFAPELRYAGFDGIMIQGTAESPAVLVIRDDSVELADGEHLWGKGTVETTEILKVEYGKKARSLVIGPAGENRVSFANIMHGAHNAFGRCGMGAVMGSKNLKAVVVIAGNRKTRYADPGAVEGLRKDLNPRIDDALASIILKDYGTPGNLEGHVYDGDVPIKNWRSNFNEEMASALTGSTMIENYGTGSAGCAFCRVVCKKKIAIPEGKYAMGPGPAPEYETVASFGTMLNSSDLEAVCMAGRICNDLGMDTISCGATLSWAMEAFERNDLSTDDTGGIELRWGDLDTVNEVLLPAIAARDGKLGGLLSRGSLAAAKTVEKNSVDYTVQSKGLEAPMHDPRGSGHGKALAYALTPRGACHVGSAMHFMEMGACYYPEIGFDYELEPLTNENKPEAAVIAMELGNIENSACYCQFVDRAITIPEWVELFNSTADYELDIPRMMEAGRRIFYLKRLINYRYGRTADDDDLTPRMLEPARDGEPAGIEMDFASMKERFYELIGFDSVRGIPTRDILSRYGLETEAKSVW